MEDEGDATIVEVGFLNYIEPDLDSAVERCIARGAQEIVIVPYFLVAGKFVKEELPRVVDIVRSRHPRVRFAVADALQSHDALAEAILASAESARDLSSIVNIAEQAERFCRQSPDCPNFGTPDCPATEPTI